MNIKKIKQILYNNGINTSLIDNMTYEELQTSVAIQDYDDYTNYMNNLARKYDI